MADDSASAAAPSMRLGLIKLWFEDIDAAVAFYEGALGWVVMRTIDLPDKLEKMMHAPGHEAGPYLVLCERKEAQDIMIGNGLGPVGFFVDDTDAIHARAIAHGGTTRLPPFDVGEMRVAFFFDPEGHELQLVAHRG